MLRVTVLACGDNVAHRTLKFFRDSLGMKDAKKLLTSSPSWFADHWASGSVRIGNTEILVIESSRINTSRRYAKKPDMLRLLGVDVINSQQSA